MKTVNGSLNFKRLKTQNPVITLGNFDGVHKGHQKIIKKALQRAHALNGIAAVYTFDPHPLRVVKPDIAPPQITTFAEKAGILEDLGIDYLIKERFTKTFSEKTPEAFMTSVICERIRPCEIIIGHDYAFGKNRKGAVDLLEKIGVDYNFRVHVVSDITTKNIPVRSTTIRQLVTAGKVSLAHKLLGRPYRLTGKVVHGHRRRIGFPTANLTPGSKLLIPENGVYAVRVETQYGMHDGVVNVGINPTFDGTKKTIEAHMFNFNRDLYGKTIAISWYKRIRGEKKFKDTRHLAERIEKDIQFAKKYLANH